MNLIDRLKQYNAWRRGEDESLEQPHPEQVGKDIDEAIARLSAAPAATMNIDKKQDRADLTIPADSPKDVVCGNAKVMLKYWVAHDIDARDIDAYGIDVRNIDARDIDAYDIDVRKINARDIDVRNIIAYDIIARNIIANSITIHGPNKWVKAEPVGVRWRWVMATQTKEQDDE